MANIFCSNCLESFTAKEFFSNLIEISSSLSAITFECPKCKKHDVYNVHETGISSQAFNHSSNKIIKISHFEKSIYDDIAILSSKDDGGEELFRQRVPINHAAISNSQSNSNQNNTQRLENDRNPYVPPTNSTSTATNTSTATYSSNNTNYKTAHDIPYSINYHINFAAFVGVFDIIVTTIYAALGNHPEMLIDSLVVFILTIGILFKSRIFSTIMVFYYIAAAIFSFQYMMPKGRIPISGAILGIAIALFFLYRYIMAMISTYKYHNHVNFYK